MAIQSKNLSICLVLCIAAIVPTLAHIGEFDDYWKKRSEKASIVNHAAFNPKPHEITDELNHHVGKALKSNNATGRHLLGHGLRQPGAPCEAINPIDKCWRCDPNWAANRKKLADCGLGFGKKAVGGKGGPIYVVTDASDDDMVNPKPGTLRHAVIQKGPLWIVFKHAMIIRLKQELLVQSEKTIDARGANVHIAWGAGITLQFVNNVIIHGLHIHDIWPTNGGMIRDAVDHVGLRTKSDGDGISIFGSSTIWIDHVSMRQCGDGLIDVVQGSTAITISNSHFTDHNEAMLFGASDKNHADQKMQITVAFNHFGKGLVQRMPRCRFGFFHIVNNDYTHWVMYAIGGSQNPTIISQGNRYIAPDNSLTKNVCNRLAQPAEWKQWSWRSENDWMVNGAFFESTGNPQAAQQFPCKEFLISPQPGLEAPKLAKYSGSLSCCEGKPC